MIRGSCLCGGVTFTVEGGLTPILYCHASRCRKATGGAFAPEVLIDRAGFRWTTGKTQIIEYVAPLLREPPAYRRAFCSRCGSPLPVALEGTPFMVALAGVLDGDPGVRPFRHSYVAQKACWHEIIDSLPQSEGRPEEPPPGWLRERGLAES
jgi:hypothetical protein